MKKIVLMGYMGCGKSTISKLLAKKLNVGSYDLDDIIEENEKKTIASIFSEKGEIYFRKIEMNTLKDFLAQKQDCVLSLGGGTPCYGDNIEIIKESDFVSIYLQASVKELAKRLAPEKDKRPMIAGLSVSELEEFIGKHLFERSAFYTQSDYQIGVDQKSPEAIVEEILTLV